MPPKYIASHSRPVFRWLLGGIHGGVLLRVLVRSFDFVVVPGWSRLTCLAVLILCVLMRKSVIIVADTIKWRSNRGFYAIAKRVFVSGLLRAASGIWVPGVASRRFFASCGAPDRKLIEGAYCLDTVQIASERKSRTKLREEIRKKHGIMSDAIVFLAIGNLVPLRRYSLLAEEFVNCTRDQLWRKTYLLIVGDGPDAEFIRETATGSRGRIILVPSIPFADVAAYLSAADVFVHPGAEPFSTALEYASLFGLQIVANRAVGYCQDLLEAGAPIVEVADGSGMRLGCALRLAHENVSGGGEQGDEISKLMQYRSVRWASRNLVSFCGSIQHK